MYVKTISGSLYEVDEQQKRVRRLYGAKNPTPRQGKDGDWRTYVSLSHIGESLFIMWNDEGQGTLTSAIEKSSDKLADLVTIH